MFWDQEAEFEFNISFLVCLDGSFGEDCSVNCEDCVNGACRESRDGCDCLPGWTGIICNESKDTEHLYFTYCFCESHQNIWMLAFPSLSMCIQQFPQVCSVKMT